MTNKAVKRPKQQSYPSGEPYSWEIRIPGGTAKRPVANQINAPTTSDSFLALIAALEEAIAWADSMDIGDAVDGDPVAGWRAALAAAKRGNR